MIGLGQFTLYCLFKRKRIAENFSSFIVRNNTKMKKVFKNYSTKMGRDQSYFRFMFDGRCIGQDDTPESVGIESKESVLVGNGRW